MIYLKKFNESVGFEEYIKTCFAEFFDNDVVEIDDYKGHFHLNIDLPKIGIFTYNTKNAIGEENYIKDSIINYIKYLDELKELILNIEVCVKNIKDEYPEIYCSIEQDDFKVIRVIFENYNIK